MSTSYETHRNQQSDTSTMEYVADQYSAMTQTTKEYIEENPGTCTLITFGAGFAIGVAIASVIGGSESHQRRNFANQISSQVVNGLSSWMPKSLRS